MQAIEKFSDGDTRARRTQVQANIPVTSICTQKYLVYTEEKYLEA